jgi:Fic family protein
METIMRNFNYLNLANQKWDNEILNYVAVIRQANAKQETYLKLKPASLERLVEVAIRQSTEASNEIEGIRTTKSRLAKLCAEKTTPKNRDEKEIAGYRDVLTTIHQSHEFIPIRPSYILQLHRDLLKHADVGFGGRFKDSQNEIAGVAADGKQFTVFLPMPPFETPDAIEAICENYNQAIAQGTVDALVLIPIFILDFLCIHPFNDGNGRMSRLLTTLLLYKAGFPIGRYISLESKIAKNKASYYDAIEASDQNWADGTNDPAPFIKYILGTIISAYRDLEDRLSIIEKGNKSLEQVRQAVGGIIGRFTKRQVLEMLPAVGKSSVENALKALVKEGLLLRFGEGRSTYYVRSDSGYSPK